jgi:hypothetical protein
VSTAGSIAALLAYRQSHAVVLADQPHLSIGIIALVAGVAVLAAGLFVWLLGRDDERDYYKGEDE